MKYGGSRRKLMIILLHLRLRNHIKYIIYIELIIGKNDQSTKIIARESRAGKIAIVLRIG
jgi:hypothetical protein